MAQQASGSGLHGAVNPKFSGTPRDAHQGAQWRVPPAEMAWTRPYPAPWMASGPSSGSLGSNAPLPQHLLDTHTRCDYRQHRACSAWLLWGGYVRVSKLYLPLIL